MASRTVRDGGTEPVSHRVMADARNRVVWELVARHDRPEPRRLLDLGCGTCVPLREFVAARPRVDGDGPGPLVVVGVDRSRLNLDDGHDPAQPPVVQAEVTALPLPSHSIDLVTCFTLFSSLPTAATRQAAADEIRRVLVPGGLLAWYDLRYPSPRNPAVTAITRRQLQRLFPGCALVSRSVSVIPPVSRRLVPRWPGIYPALVRIPWLRSHWVAVLRMPA